MAAPLGIAARALLQAAVSLPQQSKSDLKRVARGIDINFDVIGDKELIKRFKSLDPKMQPKIARKVLRAGAKTFAKEIKSRAPVDTGALRKSIKVRAVRRSRRGTIGPQVIIGKELTKYYSSFLELGTVRIDATKFIRSSVDDKRAEVLRQIEIELGRLVEQEAARSV